MKLQETAFGGAADALRDDAVATAYRELLQVLARAGVPAQTKKKSKTSFVFDQTKLQTAIRASMRGHRWQHSRLLAPAQSVGRIRISSVQSDLMKGGVHVILEFGNRASPGYNMLTRVPFGVAAGAKLTVFVTPLQRFANRIDINVSSYERMVAELGRLQAAFPSMIPGPLQVIGVEPD